MTSYPIFITHYIKSHYLLPLNMAFKILKWRFSRGFPWDFPNGQAALSHIGHGLSQAFPGPFPVSFRGGVCCLGDQGLAGSSPRISGSWTKLLRKIHHFLTENPWTSSFLDRFVDFFEVFLTLCDGKSEIHHCSMIYLWGYNHQQSMKNGSWPSFEPR